MQPATHPYQDKSFLIIDDIISFADVCKNMLKTLGAGQIDVAHNAKNALELIRNQPFDVILCDYNLGDAMNGQQLLEQLRNEHLIKFETVFVMMTGDSSSQSILGAIEYEPDDFILKPINLSLLNTRLQRWLTRQTIVQPLLCALNANDDDAVVELAGQIAIDHPKYRTWCFRHRIFSLIRLQKYSQAQQELTQPNALSFLPWQWYAKANIFYLNNQFSTAIECLQRLIKEQPSYIKAYDLLVLCHLQQQQLPEAYEALKIAAKKSANNFQRQNKIAQLGGKLGDYQGAIRAHKKLIKLAAHSSYQDAGQYHRYIELLESAIEHDTDNAVFYQHEEENAINQMMHHYRYDRTVELKADIYRLHLAHEPNQSLLLAQLLERTPFYFDEIDPALTVEILQLAYDHQKNVLATHFAHQVLTFYQNDPHLLCLIHERMAEPINLQQREYVLELNKTATQLQRNKQYPESQASYLQALDVSPRNTLVILNYALLLIRLSDTTMINTQASDNTVVNNAAHHLLTQASHLVLRLDFIDQYHPQHARKQTILTKIEAHKRQLSSPQ